MRSTEPQASTRRRVVVHGRVQGVFFRGATVDEALRAQVTGWVRNRPDSTLEAVFEGTPEAVASMLAFCERGPRGARVDRVESFEEAPQGLHDFRVRDEEWER